MINCGLVRALRVKGSVAICLTTTLLTSCVGWGDMFQEKRVLVGPYFLVRSEGAQSSQSYLFRRGGYSGSIAGPIKAIGWSSDYVIVQNEGANHKWDIFAIRPDHPVPKDDEAWWKLQGQLAGSVKFKSPESIWNREE